MSSDMETAHEEIEAAIRALAASRKPIDRLSAPQEAGIYGIYLRVPGALLPFVEGENGLIYIGLSTNLATREFDMHFSSSSTGFSTLRRSIGALLKQQLSLRPQPRSPGPSETNLRCYRFDPTGEERLTEWMRENLEVGVHATRLYEQIETSLISQLKPLLNLLKWPNPKAREIKKLRKVCADEARVARDGMR